MSSNQESVVKLRSIPGVKGKRTKHNSSTQAHTGQFRLPLDLAALDELDQSSPVVTGQVPNFTDLVTAAVKPTRPNSVGIPRSIIEHFSAYLPAYAVRVKLNEFN